MIVVRDEPEGLDEGLLRDALRVSWGIDAALLEYAPVGFGDYHWVVGGSDGRRWFATATDLSRRQPEGPHHETGAAFAGLRQAMDVAAALREQAGLEFVVAPVRAADTGTTLRPLGPRYALGVFPYSQGVPGEFGDELSARDRGLVIDLLAVLHSTAPPASTPVRPLRLAGRAGLERALDEAGRPWSGGPYSEAARELIGSHAATLRGKLRDFDEISRNVGQPVVTHGEPHPGNLLRLGDRYVLVDWDTVGLAVPERDLWLVARDSDDLARYADATGRTPDPAALELYRLRWSLDDVAEFVDWLRSPHGHTADAEQNWQGLAETVDHLANGVASAH